MSWRFTRSCNCSLYIRWTSAELFYIFTNECVFILPLASTINCWIFPSPQTLLTTTMTQTPWHLLLHIPNRITYVSGRVHFNVPQRWCSCLRNRLHPRLLYSKAYKQSCLHRVCATSSLLGDSYLKVLLGLNVLLLCIPVSVRIQPHRHLRVVIYWSNSGLYILPCLHRIKKIP